MQHIQSTSAIMARKKFYKNPRKGFSLSVPYTDVGSLRTDLFSHYTNTELKSIHQKHLNNPNHIGKGVVLHDHVMATLSNCHPFKFSFGHSDLTIWFMTEDARLLFRMAHV